jgi:hypothetical protein
MKTLYVSHASKSFDYKNGLYVPLRNSTLNSKVNLILPHEISNAPFDSKSLMKLAKDLAVLAELSSPSVGRDMELGMAYIADIPVIGIFKSGSILSDTQMLPCINLIEYESIESIIKEIENSLGV